MNLCVGTCAWCMCVFAHLWELVWCMCAPVCACLWMPQVDCFPPSLATLDTEAGSPLILELVGLKSSQPAPEISCPNFSVTGGLPHPLTWMSGL